MLQATTLATYLTDTLDFGLGVAHFQLPSDHPEVLADKERAVGEARGVVAQRAKAAEESTKRAKGGSKKAAAAGKVQSKLPALVPTWHKDHAELYQEKLNHPDWAPPVDGIYPPRLCAKSTVS